MEPALPQPLFEPILEMVFLVLFAHSLDQCSVADCFDTMLENVRNNHPRASATTMLFLKPTFT
jgi:hypothetical protein